MEAWIYKIKILYNVENTHIGQTFLAVNLFKFVFCFLNIDFNETFKMDESFFLRNHLKENCGKWHLKILNYITLKVEFFS